MGRERFSQVDELWLRQSILCIHRTLCVGIGNLNHATLEQRTVS